MCANCYDKINMISSESCFHQIFSKNSNIDTKTHSFRETTIGIDYKMTWNIFNHGQVLSKKNRFGEISKVMLFIFFCCPSIYLTYWFSACICSDNFQLPYTIHIQVGGYMKSDTSKLLVYNLQLPYKYDRLLGLFQQVNWGDIWQLEGNTTGWSDRTGRKDRTDRTIPTFV